MSILFKRLAQYSRHVSYFQPFLSSSKTSPLFALVAQVLLESEFNQRRLPATATTTPQDHDTIG